MSTKRIFLSAYILLSLLSSLSAFGQKYTISGKVTDATTGEPLGYATVYFKELRKATSTSFEGFYTLKTDTMGDSLTALYLGYRTRKKPVNRALKEQVINFQLDPSDQSMADVTITPGENKAWPILRGVWAHKDQNDRRKLEAYQYESYTKLEMDADNISEKFRNSAPMRPFRNIFDSLKLASGDDGKPILPFFISETLSDIYYLKSPERKSEHIRASKLSGVGLESGALASQLVGSSTQDYNFYSNWITILEKNFVSPISEGGLSWYKYYLVDSAMLDGHWCYKIEFKPKRPKDLVFTGSMWIQDTIFALKRIQTEIGKEANLNYVERLKIQQDLEPTTAGPWIPTKVRILLDIAEITDKSFGMLVKMYVSNREVKVNEPKPLKFYEDRLSQEANAQDHDEAFWDQARHDSLTAEDKQVAHMIDTIKNMPKVRTYIDIADFLVNGTLTLNKVDIGPYILLYGRNVIEGNRFRLGFRTNEKFSRTWILKGYAAIGTRDIQTNGLKYNMQVERFLSRENWTKVGIQHRYDVEGLGINEDFFGDNTLLTASSQLGLLTRMNKVMQSRIWLESDFGKGFNGRVFLMRRNLTPLETKNFTFSYFPEPGNYASELSHQIRTAEVSAEIRWAYKSAWLVNGNRRKRIGIDKAPILNLAYTMGLNNVLGSNTQYHRLNFTIKQIMKTGFLGRGVYNLTYNRVFGQVPYPLLNILPGNQTVIRTETTFNMLRFFEMVTDQSVTLFYTQHFDGLLMNRIPLINRLKWREVVGGKAAVGWLSPGNHISSDQYPDGITPFSVLDPKIPYVEVSYGFENIFRFFRLEAIHRLNYLTPGAPKFAIKGSLYFSF